ncbi:MAG: hypothetical protein FGM24_04470 [Candidatus Kapabacteria bacterium]|nr:hypothetical protein [Candidatus Kapabacteria bacterium]
MTNAIRRRPSRLPSLRSMIAFLGFLWASVVVLLIVSIMCSGCTSLHPNHDKADRIMWVDACKYLAFRNDRANIIVHAGDCPNPVHRRVDTVWLGAAQEAQSGGRP